MTEQYDTAAMYVAKDHSHTFLVFDSGNKYEHAVAMGRPVKVVKLPLGGNHSQLYLRDEPYPIKRAAETLLKAGERLGITDRAKAICQAAAKG